MEKYKYIFVVLVYKNTEVLEGFFSSLIDKVSNYKVILVNSYYDEESLRNCHAYADKHNAVFIPIENKGYSYGNNVGIKYALDKYEFEYLVVSNSDIIVESLDQTYMSDPIAIYAPETTMLTGKCQNPNIVTYNAVHFKCVDLGYKHKIKAFLLLARLYSGSSRMLFRFYAKLVGYRKIQVFSCHGSFFVMTRQALDLLMPVFNDKMFLYNEEGYLAFKCRFLNIPIFYIPSLKVTHLEGASSNGHSTFNFQMNLQSYLIMRQCAKTNKYN